MNVQKQTKGFTIIEVVLVLAIAALIFLMIFVALPALQRGQRNTARKEDVGTIAAAVNSYKSNHNGELPSDTASITSYLDKLSQVDKENGVTVKDSADTGLAASEDSLDTAIIFKKSKCDDDNKPATGTSRQAAVVTTLEEGSGYVLYCQGV